MVWWPFAPKPERADTLEVTDLHSGAPPLYSTLFVVRICFFERLVVVGPFAQAAQTFKHSTETTKRELFFLASLLSAAPIPHSQHSDGGGKRDRHRPRRENSVHPASSNG